MMDDPNITMEEYIKVQAEKAQRRGRTFNWETATYGKYYCDDLDFFTDLEADYPAIVYNDALTSNENVSSEPTSYSQDMALPPRDQRHTFLRFKELEYIDADIADFEERLGKIYDRSHAWRRLFKIRGPLVHELILELFSTFRFGETIPDLDTIGALQFQLDGVKRRMSWIEFILAMGLQIAKEMRGISSEGDFLGTDPSYTAIRDPMLRLCHRLIACSIAGRSQASKKVTATNLFYLRGCMLIQSTSLIFFAWYLRRFASGRKRGAMISGGQFICNKLDDTWAWVAPGPERQPDAAVGTLEVAEGDSDVDEEQRDVLDSMARAFSRFTTWTVTSLSLMMDQSGIRIPEIGLHGFPIFCKGPRWKEIDNVGEVLII
ncbi:hypothetical protein Tco_1473527 [Tanacetum coccineum]